MKTLSDFPNLDIVLKKLSLVNNLVENIYKLKTDETLIGLSIVNAIENKTPVNEVLKYVKEMALDNRSMVEGIISCELTEEIINI